jgi:formylglycine-generating enzyme required for sulfatase activity
LAAKDIEALYSYEKSEMVNVQGGTLPSSSGLAGHAVAPFRIGKYEVTWEEWQTVRTYAIANGYDLTGVGAGTASTHPVHSVSWYDAVKWCNAKSQKEGLVPVYTVNGTTYKAGQVAPTQSASANGYRLPSEKEWEWAARGGEDSQGYTYSGSNDVDAVAWYRDNSSGGTLNIAMGRGTWPVGQKGANELGLHDMSGNVMEWCWDDFDVFTRISRGGHWNDDASWCNVANVGTDDIGARYFSHGFRLARTRYLMTFSELIATNPNYETAKDLAIIITQEQAQIFADTQNAYGDPRHVPSPVALSDGTLFLSADLLTEIGPNGLYRSWFQHLPQDLFPQIYIIPMSEAIALIPALEQID